eukprot:6463781-Amphidinium_carterae.1
MTTVSARPISPHSVGTRPGKQSRFMDVNALLARRRKTMQLDTRRSIKGRGRTRSLAPLSRPSITVMRCAQGPLLRGRT